MKIKYNNYVCLLNIFILDNQIKNIVVYSNVFPIQELDGIKKNCCRRFCETFCDYLCAITIFDCFSHH